MVPEMLRPEATKSASLQEMPTVLLNAFLAAGISYR
jgi:hypothetical protein